MMDCLDTHARLLTTTLSSAAAVRALFCVTTVLGVTESAASAAFVCAVSGGEGVVGRIAAAPLSRSAWARERGERTPAGAAFSGSVRGHHGGVEGTAGVRLSAM